MAWSLATFPLRILAGSYSISGPDGHLIAVWGIRILLDNDSFQKLAMTFFQECKGLAVVGIVLKGVLYKLKTSVVFVQNLAPGLHADGKIGATIH